MHTQSDIKNASDSNNQRLRIISQNRSRRFKGVTPLPVPEKIILFGYELFVDGSYEGFICTDDESEAKEEAEQFQSDGTIPSGKITLKKKRSNDHI